MHTYTRPAGQFTGVSRSIDQSIIRYTYAVVVNDDDVRTMRELMRRLSFSDRVSDGGGVPRGCVPVLVCGGDGGDESSSERFVVRVEALRHPSFAALLEMAAQEFGYKQEGILRVPCDVRHFKQVLAAVSVSSPRSRN